MSASDLNAYFSKEIAQVLSSLVHVGSPGEWASGEIARSSLLDLRTGEPIDSGLADAAVTGDDRWSYVRISWGSVHPALASVIGDLLDLSAEEVLAVARFEAWIDPDDGFAMPPGRTVDDGEDVPFWVWPPTGNWTVTDWAYAVIEDDEAAPESRKAAQRIVELHELPRLDDATVERAFDTSGPLGIYSALSAIDPAVAGAFAKQWGVEPRGLIAGLLPVPPLADRPLESRAGGVEAPGVENLAISQLVQALNRMARMDEWLQRGEGVPRASWALEHINVQRAFERAVQALGGWLKDDRWWEDDATAQDWTPAGEPLREAAHFDRYAPLDPVRPTAIGFAADRLVVDFPYVTLTLDFASGRVLQMCRTSGSSFLAVNPDETRALFTAGWDYLVRDLETGAWLDVAEDWPRHIFYEAMERAYLVDRARNKRIHLDTVYDYPVRLVSSSDGEYIWATDKESSGGVYSHEGQLQFEPWWPGTSIDDVPILQLDGSLVMPSALSSDELDEIDEIWSAGSAFQLTPDDRWIFIDEGTVFVDLEPVFRFGFRADAVGIRHDGSQFAVACGTRLSVFDFENDAARLVARFELEPLRIALGPEVADEIENETERRVLHAALSRWGTLAEVAAATDEELLELDLSNDFEVARPIERAHVDWLRGITEHVGELPEELPRT